MKRELRLGSSEKTLLVVCILALASWGQLFGIPIDPDLVFATYLGGADSELAEDPFGYPNLAIAVGRNGMIYLAGATFSDDFPTTPRVLGPFLRGSADVFVVGIDTTTEELIFATYLGGSGIDSVSSISIESSGRIVVAGNTSSIDFPTSPGALSASLKGPTDAFVSKLEPDGSALAYSTYFGGAESDVLRDLQLDQAGNLYLAGYTQSSDLPTTPGALKALHRADQMEDGFVAKMDPEGALLYLTYLAGQGPATDRVLSIAPEGGGTVLVTGVTDDPAFPVSSGAHATTSSGQAEAFVARLNADGTELTESTFFGGSGDDQVFDLAVGKRGEIWLAGITSSKDLPTGQHGTFPVYSGGDTDVFLGCLDSDLSNLPFMSYLGGSGSDGGFQSGPSLALDQQGTIHLTGGTSSFDFPVTPDAFMPDLSSSNASDAWYLRLHSEAGLLFATYLGGFGADDGHAIAVDRRGSAFIAGVTASSDFPLVNPIQSTFAGGSSDLFVAEVSNPIGATVLLAEKSIHLKEGSKVLSGDIVVNDVGRTDLDLQFEAGVTTPIEFEVKADGIKVKPGAELRGFVHFNRLDDGGSITGYKLTPLDLPVFDFLPQFSNGSAGPNDVTIPKNKIHSLEPGHYRDLEVEKNGVVNLTGGTYNFRSVILKPRAHLEFQGPTEVRIESTLQSAPETYMGPSEESLIRPSEIIFYIAGLVSKPLNQIEDGSSVRVNLYAPNGQLKFGKDSYLEGAFIAQDIIVNANCVLSLDSYFATLIPAENSPPVATDDSASTSEDQSFILNVLANDTDPDGDELKLAGFTQPQAGMVSLGSQNQLVYTPQDDFFGADTFTYTASDGRGGFDTGIVTLTVQPVNDPPSLTLSADSSEGEAPLTVTFTATVNDADSDPLTFLWNFGEGTIKQGSAFETHTYQGVADYSALVTVTDGSADAQAVLTISVSSSLPSDPREVAPSLDRTRTTTLDIATRFLYTGSDPIQTGVTEGTVEARRAAVVRGRVLDRENRPLSGVAIAILNHPELGQTLSRGDGWFDLAVNGGGDLTVVYVKSGYLGAQRQAYVPWHEIVVMPDVALIEPDTLSTTIDFSADVMQVARASAVSDDHGTRRATLLFRPGTQAEIIMSDGSVYPSDLLEVRATEFTVGQNGPHSMPADLPPTTAYTYCVALTADEALDAGATQVRFNQSVPFYVENFLGFPVGISVPLGYYNPFEGKWTASDSGRVISLLSVSGGIAELDVEGNGLPADSDTLTALGISVAERQQLAELYSPGQSLWRVLIPHFSSWDLNWGVSPPPNAVAAFVQEYLPWLVEDPCLTVGSQIECQTQILGESIPIAGTPYSLNYRSDRVEGAKFANTLTVKVSDATVPESLKRIDVELTAGGKRLHRSFAPLPDQITTFTWDGLDVYGRKLQGKVPATIKVGYVYDGVYTATERFGYQGNGELITDGQSRTELVFWSSHLTSFGTWQPLPEGLGGWTLEPHHRFDVVGKTLHYGDGRRRHRGDVVLIADTVTKMGTETIGDPHEIEAGPDGSLHIPDGNGELRKISPEGEYSTIATGLGGADDVALAADGTLYVSDSWTHRVWKVQPDGKVEPAAGNGTLGYSGDGGPAVEAQLASPKGIAVATDGTLYIAESNNHVVRRVTPDGVISTLAGTGAFGDSGDGGPAASAFLRNPSDVALRSDGSVLVTDSSAGKVRQISTDGLITTVAGNGLSSGEFEEGIPAVQTRLFSPRGIAVDREDNLFITEYSYYHGNVIRSIDSSGIIRHFAGKLSSVGNTAEDRLPALQTLLPTCKGLAVGPDGTVLVAVSGRIRSVYPALPGFTSNQLMIASEDGSELYEFDPFGRHLRTLNALTGGVLHEFIYDAAGVLTTVTDGDGNQTAIERDGAGSPTAIVAPFGQRTNLTVDSNGYLVSVTNPAAGRVTMAYTPDGLLQTFTDARSHTSSFQFDSLGRLIKDTDAASGYQALFRTDWNKGIEVLRSTALNRVTSYRVEELDSGDQRQLLTFPSGAENESVKANDATRSYNFANGTRAEMALGPDPRFGMLVPVVNSLTLTTPSGLASTVTTTRISDSADPDDPLSLVTQTEIETINGRVFTRAFDSARLEFTSTSAEGRETRSYVDSQGRVVEKHIPGLFPVRFRRDSSGRLVEIAQGIGDEERRTSLSYNSKGFVESATDPVGQTIGFEYDPVGRIISQTMAGGRSINYSLDPNGNTMTLSPPGRPEHIFSYNQVNLEDQYGPPPIGSDVRTKSYAYNLDRQLEQVRRLDGQTVDYKYNAAGQLTEIVLPRGAIQAAYEESTGQLVSLTSPQGQTIQFIYDGHLPNQESWIGEVSGTVARTYDSNFRLKSESVNGANTASYIYDKDGLLTKLGDLTISRDPQNGLYLRSTLGSVDETWSYNGFGEPIEHRITVSGSVVYAVHFDRDRLGRISSRTETLEGVTETHAYTYDVSGRLAMVHRNGSTVSSYEYDSNNNRVAGTTVAGAISAQYDVQDRLLDYRGSTYSYTEEGELLEKTSAGQTTSYDYDVLGNLRAVDLADGTRIEYLVDARNRRIGKKVNGILVQGFLYGDQLHPVAELDGSGSLVTRFFYTNRLNSPDYMVKNGTSYRIVSDHLGSPRLVIDITTGAIAQRIDYDEFGNILLDTNPGLQPFGFAGGLYEGDTALVRFGARDYDPEVGRWTAKDPIRFAGGDSNLYGYVLNDPVNLVDPFGRFGDGFARGGSYWGHSDFYGSDRFDYVKEDYGWSQPFNPFSTWKHFRPIDDVESSLKRAVCRRNEKEFARLMHHGQDYFSHFEKGYRAFHAFPFRGGWPLPGHVIAGHSPDQDQRAWTTANQWTRIWVKRWDNPGLCGCE